MTILYLLLRVFRLAPSSQAGVGAPPLRPVSPLDDLEDTYGPYETQRAPAAAHSSLAEEAYNGDVERSGSISTVFFQCSGLVVRDWHVMLEVSAAFLYLLCLLASIRLAFSLVVSSLSYLADVIPPRTTTCTFPSPSLHVSRPEVRQIALCLA